MILLLLVNLVFLKITYRQIHKQFFNVFELVELIFNETNRYAQQCISKTPLKARLGAKKWTPLTASELKIYLGLISHRAVVSKPTYDITIHQMQYLLPQ